MKFLHLFKNTISYSTVFLLVGTVGHAQTISRETLAVEELDSSTSAIASSAPMNAELLNIAAGKKPDSKVTPLPNSIAKPQPVVADTSAHAAEDKTPPATCNPVPDPCCPPKPQINLVPAYNLSAAVDLQCGWDVWANGSFIYWQASGENLEVAVLDSSTASGSTTSLPVDGSILNMSFGYKPGFKVGLGFTSSDDDWDLYADYTYLRTKNTTSGEAPNPGQIRSLWISPAILLTEDAGFALFEQGSATWVANFDLVDASVGRWYYCGKKLTMHPFFGLRGAFIRQKYDTAFVSDTDITQETHDHVHSWAVGPRTGVDTSWHVGRGFRFYGNSSADILYSSYKITSSQTGASEAEEGDNQLSISQDNLDQLKAHLDLELGIGWTSNMCRDKAQFDLSAGYDFQIFFGQIMFRKWLDDVDPVKSLAPFGNLFLQGLTVKAQLDF